MSEHISSLLVDSLSKLDLSDIIYILSLLWPKFCLLLSFLLYAASSSHLVIVCNHFSSRVRRLVLVFGTGLGTSGGFLYHLTSFFIFAKVSRSQALWRALLSALFSYSSTLQPNIHISSPSNFSPTMCISFCLLSGGPESLWYVSGFFLGKSLQFLFFI